MVVCVSSSADFARGVSYSSYVPSYHVSVCTICHILVRHYYDTAVLVIRIRIHCMHRILVLGWVLILARISWSIPCNHVTREDVPAPTLPSHTQIHPDRPPYPEPPHIFMVENGRQLFHLKDLFCRIVIVDTVCALFILNTYIYPRLFVTPCTEVTFMLVSCFYSNTSVTSSSVAEIACLANTWWVMSESFLHVHLHVGVIPWGIVKFW